ncbi:hypothetical protein AVEN_26712-1 [Araneus ventricosus]|uniref:Uncharacterized protein n=1 Tax=Araneus ventricosus TaxID=182803 RepID=A0A4Y2T3Y7_ARAVE|nr:hypothetical protein AVEN_26712-1 [Araneus ventricosus]
MTYLNRWAENWKDEERFVPIGLEHSPGAVVRKPWGAKFKDIYLIIQNVYDFSSETVVVTPQGVAKNLAQTEGVGNEKSLGTTSLVNVQLNAVDSGLFLYNTYMTHGYSTVYKSRADDGNAAICDK